MYLETDPDMFSTGSCFKKCQFYTFVKGENGVADKWGIYIYILTFCIVLEPSIIYIYLCDIHFTNFASFVPYLYTCICIIFIPLFS